MLLGLQRVRRLARSNTVDTSTANKIINRLNNTNTNPSVSQPGSPKIKTTLSNPVLEEQSSIHSDPTSAVSTPTTQAAPSSTLVRKMSSRTSRKIVLNDQIMAMPAQAAVVKPPDNFDMEQMQKSLLLAEQSSKKSSRKSHRDSAQQWEIPPEF